MKICTSCLNSIIIFGFYKNGTTMGCCRFCNCYDVVNTMISSSDLEILSKPIEEMHPFILILRRHINHVFLEDYVKYLDEEEFYWFMHGLTS